MSKKLILLLVCAMSCSAGAFAQQVAVKTNALYWATTTLNVAVETALSNKSTISVGLNYNPWDRITGKNGRIKHWYIQPEYRYWLCEKYTRSFFGFHLIGGQYDLGGFGTPFNISPSFRDHYYKGWGVGCGVSYGYDFYLSPHWSLEASVGVGYVHFNYVGYDLKGNRTGHNTKNYVGPTQVGITFVYLFKSKK